MYLTSWNLQPHNSVSRRAMNFYYVTFLNCFIIIYPGSNTVWLTIDRPWANDFMSVITTISRLQRVNITKRHRPQTLACDYVMITSYKHDSKTVRKMWILAHYFKISTLPLDIKNMYLRFSWNPEANASKIICKLCVFLALMGFILIVDFPDW